jgi:hypothetical protein
LKSRQKSTLIPFPSPDGSFDCPRQAVFLEKNFIEKDFDFLAQKGFRIRVQNPDSESTIRIQIENQNPEFKF